MTTVTVSPKFQVVIPKDVRRGLKLTAGEKLIVIEKDGTIRLIPVGKLSEARGLVKEISSEELRDETERFD